MNSESSMPETCCASYNVRLDDLNEDKIRFMSCFFKQFIKEFNYDGKYL